MKDIKYQTRILFGRLGHGPGVGLGVLWGGGGGGLGGATFFRNLTIFGMWVTYMNGTCNGTIFLVPAPWGLREGPKGQILLNLNHKVYFKDF